MNNSLEINHFIDRALLREDNYFLSLLEQAYNKELLSDKDIERIQYECLALLAEKTERYNSGDSSSIQIEKAKEILNSVLYTIGICLKSFPNPDDAVTELQKMPLKELYQNGRKKIDRLLTATKSVHSKLLSKLFVTPNAFYSSTIKDGVYGFFKSYYPDFFAHETNFSASYPLFNAIQDFRGIEFIKFYVQGAFYENQFMSFFSPEDIHHLLCGYEENYRELQLNLYEPVLITALGCIIAETDLMHLDITEHGVNCLSGKFMQKTEAEITEIISNASVNLNEKLKLSQGLFQYIQSSLPKVIRKISAAVSENTLNRLFILPVYPEDKPKLIISYGTRMDDEVYRNVLDEIIMCDALQDKVSVIKKHIHSFADLEDVLLDAEMTPVELRGVLSELSLPEIAALSKKYCLQFEIDVINLREQERVLRESLQKYISDLPPEQQTMIKQVETVLQEE